MTAGMSLSFIVAKTSCYRHPCRPKISSACSSHCPEDWRSRNRLHRWPDAKPCPSCAPLLCFLHLLEGSASPSRRLESVASISSWWASNWISSNRWSLCQFRWAPGCSCLANAINLLCRCHKIFKNLLIQRVLHNFKKNWKVLHLVRQLANRLEEKQSTNLSCSSSFRRSANYETLTDKCRLTLPSSLMLDDVFIISNIMKTSRVNN